MQALIDGDVVTYQCGFASDEQIYTCPDGAEYHYKKEAKEHCEKFGFDVTAITKRVEPEPVEHCLHSVKIFINSMINEIGADEKKIFLTGTLQDRKQWYPSYKANRDASHKPHWYKEIHQYLIDVHGAEVIVGSEADDAMAWWQWRDPGTKANDQLAAETCICTIDKDLNMVPGFHFNWQADGGKGDLFWVEPETADRLFFEQWLVGDSSDNIPGLRGVGAKTATKMLASCPDEPKALYSAVMVQYKNGTPASGLHPHLIGDLLWMQRKPGQRWDEFYGIERKD